MKTKENTLPGIEKTSPSRIKVVLVTLGVVLVFGGLGYLVGTALAKLAG
jgi:hypothetical protein